MHVRERAQAITRGEPLSAMSLVPAKLGAMAPEAFESPSVVISSSVIAVVITLVLMRGVVSFFVDIGRILRHLLGRKHQEKGGADRTVLP